MCISKSQFTGRLACIIVAVLASSLAAQTQRPDNAALLYYQAFLEYEGPQDESEDVALNLFQHGYTDSNDVITSHIERNRRVIDLAVTAADIAHCDWGSDVSQFDDEAPPPYLSGIRRITFLIQTEIRWLIEQGRFQTAWDRCMTIHKMAAHAGSDEMWITYLVARSIDAIAIRCTREALPLAPSDVDILTQMRAELTQATASPPSLAACIRRGYGVRATNLDRNEIQSQIRQSLEFDEYFNRRGEMIEQLQQTEEDSPEFVREYVDTLRKRDEAKERLLQGNEALFQCNREHIIGTADRLASVVEMDLPYAQTCMAFDDLSQQLDEEMANGPNLALAFLAESFEPPIRRTYELATQRQARLNANLAAIDVYIALAQAGHLPETLPANSPPDPFSGLPFDYAKTADGFTLTCRGEDIPETETEGYEFKVSQ